MSGYWLAFRASVGPLNGEARRGFCISRLLVFEEDLPSFSGLPPK